MKKFRRHIFFFLFLLAAAGALFAVLRPAPVRHKTASAAPKAKPAAAPLQAHGIVLSYKIYAAGFTALDASFSAAADRKNYSIKMTAVTKGLIGHLFPWRTAAKTDGDVTAAGGLVPRRHIETSDWRKHAYAENISYDAAGVMQARKLTDNGKPMSSQPVDPALAAGAGDILTATLALLQNAAHGAKDVQTDKCKGSYTVYDGRRRYAVTLTDAGAAAIAPSRYSIFQGKALRCYLELVPVAGFTAGDKKRGWWAIQNYTEKRHKPPTVWLARAQNGMMMIVRMEIDSAYGAAVANLVGEKSY